MRYLFVLVLLSTLALQITSLPDGESDSAAASVSTDDASASSPSTPPPPPPDTTATPSGDQAPGDGGAAKQDAAPTPLTQEKAPEQPKKDGAQAGDSAAPASDDSNASTPGESSGAPKDKVDLSAPDAAPKDKVESPAPDAAPKDKVDLPALAAAPKDKAGPPASAAAPKVKADLPTPSATAYPELPPKSFNQSTKGNASDPANSGYGKGAIPAANATNGTYPNNGTNTTTNGTKSTNTSNGTNGTYAAKTNLSNALEDAKDRIAKAASILTSNAEENVKMLSWTMTAAVAAALNGFY